MHLTFFSTNEYVCYHKGFWEEMPPALTSENRKTAMSLETLMGIYFIYNGVNNEFCMIGAH